VTVDLSLDRTRFLTGESVSGTITVLGALDASVEVCLCFVERTADYSAVPLALPSGRLFARGESPMRGRRFDIDLPSDALPSLSSPYGELYWEVLVVTEERRAQTLARQRIDVLPRRADELTWAT